MAITRNAPPFNFHIFLSFWLSCRLKYKWQFFDLLTFWWYLLDIFFTLNIASNIIWYFKITFPDFGSLLTTFDCKHVDNVKVYSLILINLNNIIILSQFWPLLKKVVFFEVDGIVSEIGSNVKPQFRLS